MRENCTYGSEGGAASAVPTPINDRLQTEKSVAAGIFGVYRSWQDARPIFGQDGR